MRLRRVTEKIGVHRTLTYIAWLQVEEFGVRLVMVCDDGARWTSKSVRHWLGKNWITADILHCTLQANANETLRCSPTHGHLFTTVDLEWIIRTVMMAIGP